MHVSGTGNNRSYFGLDVDGDGSRGLQGRFSDGNSLMVNVHSFDQAPLHGLMCALWYEYGFRKPVTAITEWWLFEAWWTNEVYRRLGLIVKHPRELLDKVHTTYGVITTATGILYVPEAEMHIGVDIANFPPIQHIRDWHRIETDKFINRTIEE